MKTLLKVIPLFLIIATVGCGMQNSPFRKPQPQQQINQQEEQVHINLDLAEKAKGTAGITPEADKKRGT